MKIITREEWGARYEDGFKDAPVPFREWWLHHSVTVAPDLLPPFEDEEAAMRLLEKIGQEKFGGGVSYTYAVMPNGRVYQGHTIDRQGAHTKGRNDVARAVVLVGNYDRDHVTPAQVEAVAELLVQCWRRGWCPTPYLSGGHQEAPGAQTACPGRYGLAAVDVINTRAEQLARAADHQEEPDMARSISDEDAELIAAKVWARDLGATKGGGVELPNQSAKDRVNALHRLNVLQKEKDGVLMAQLSALDPEKIAAAVPLEVAGAVVSALLARAHAAPPPATVRGLVAAVPDDEPAETVPAAFVEADAAAGWSEPAAPYVEDQPSQVFPAAALPVSGWATA